ncbi:hypothetical protein [Kocuria rosea]|uniref:hypothetical protein n=1 Tax=Kocuria rosea TaxID=1275 RepID=UPI0025B75EB2|nr:hypothetical protein [Kocuria rosea]WJZ68336.1 hypothetical protein QR564_17955 [Kocuria rosea]
MKHDTNIQFVPDRTEGDHGLEAFRLDEGIVYQCYSPAEYFTIPDQTAAQKRKITADIKKLYDYKEGLEEMLGGDYRINRWVLLTPYVEDKELLKHARKKSNDVKGNIDRPTWWTPEFQIAVFTDEDHFPEELQRLYAGSNNLAFRLPVPESIDTTDADLTAFDTRLEEKLTKSATLAGDEEHRKTVKESILLEYVIGQVRVRELERKYTEVWNKVDRISKLELRKYQRNIIFNPPTTDPSDALAEQLAEKIRQDEPALPAGIADELAWHFVASWWIQCPLSYSQVAS